jgi:hypothetical protein
MSILLSSINRPRFNPTFYKGHSSIHLYQIVDDQITLFKLKVTLRSRHSAIYKNVPYICDNPITDQHVTPVDVHFHSKSISVVGGWYFTPVPLSNTAQILTLKEAYDWLPSSIQQTCGKIVFPPDSGTTLPNDIVKKSGTFFGASDVSLKYNCSSHAWIILSGSVQDIEDPL